MNSHHSYSIPGACCHADLLDSMTLLLLPAVIPRLPPCISTLCKTLPLTENSWIQVIKESEKCSLGVSRSL